MLKASLPMYDLPELRAATDAWWRGLAQAFRQEGLTEVPERLERGDEMAALWQAPDLLFSQTCGYPLTHSLKGKVCLVATPVYDCPGCEGGLYHSEILVRRYADYGDLADLKGARAVANDVGSQSGYSALRAAIAPLAKGKAFFSELRFSGGHRASMAQVFEGEADVCAVDCLTYRLIAKAEPEAVAGLRSLAISPSAPALPYITRLNIPADELSRLRQGLLRAFDDPALRYVRGQLLLCGVEVKPLSAYDRIEEIEAAAFELGYPALA